MKILVADDAAIQRMHAKKIFTELGFETICVKDGLEALHVLRNEANLIAACFVDYQMPNCDGLLFLKYAFEIKSAKDLPVFIVSADAGFADHAKKLGARGWLYKPMQAIAIEKALRKMKILV
jgi:two-component system, chemotaxis family, chemotaxis protein CheY